MGSWLAPRTVRCLGPNAHSSKSTRPEWYKVTFNIDYKFVI